MKAEDKVAMLLATNQAFAGGDDAKSLLKKWQREAGQDNRRWRPSRRKRD